jgi:hypothetical protein
VCGDLDFERWAECPQRVELARCSPSPKIRVARRSTRSTPRSVASDRSRKIFGDFVKCRIDNVIRPFNAGRRVAQNCPKLLNGDCNVSKSLARQIIFEARALLVLY